MTKNSMKSAIETIAVSIHVFNFLLLGPVVIAALVALLFTPMWIIPIVYAGWMYYDRYSEIVPRKKSLWAKNWIIWRLIRDYFPITLCKDGDTGRSDSSQDGDTVHLDPKNNYLLLNHPHGIVCYGTYIALGTEACGFSRMFPGIDTYTAVLNTMFKMPLWREIILSLGGRRVDRETFDNILGGKTKGKLLTVVVGGAREALDACPGRMDFTLRNRKGVFKLALKHGAHLVPCISFGENDVYKQEYRSEEDTLKIFQKKIMKKIHFSIPYFHGRSFTLIPYRRPICLVGEYYDYIIFILS